MSSGRPAFPYVAQQPGQRQLSQPDTTFTRIVDTALQYLANSELTRVDIAFLTGFSNQSAFHRAFKRWTGADAPGIPRSTARLSGGL